MQFRDNHVASRFELEENGHIAFADYQRIGDVLHLPHVEAPAALRGTGAAGRLMQAIVEKAREDGFKLHPICSYAVAWLQKHPETRDILA